MASNEVSRNLRDLQAKLPSMLEKRMGQACAVVRNDAVKSAPSKTGELRRSIDFQVSHDGTEGIIFSNLKYAPYVEVGTGIYSKKGGRDTPWTYPMYDHGKVRFVKTRGMRPRPYLEPALQQNSTKIRQCFEGLF